jgi:hypothetical protein
MDHKKLTLDLQIPGMRKKSLDVLLLWEFSQLRRFMWYEQSKLLLKALCPDYTREMPEILEVFWV